MTEQKKRDVLFIGHANPEDNEFTLWLRQKLVNEGYRAECDISILIGGENDYWKNIQECLEESTCKYILVLSNHTFSKNGVLDEWEHIRSIQKKNNINDFILPLKIDSVPFDARIGLNRINVIDFSSSWAYGLKKLLRKIESDTVPKFNNSTKLTIKEWAGNRNSLGQGVTNNTENYYTNWVEIHDLPLVLFIYEYSNDTQADFIKHNLEYPCIRHDRFIITFMKDIEPVHFIKDGFFINKDDNFIKHVSKKEVLVDDIIHNVESNNFPSLQDSKNFLVHLLKEALHKFLLSRGMKIYEYSGLKFKCYYYTNEIKTIIYTYKEKTRRKKLVGKYFNSFWHLGISMSIKMYPVVAYEIKSHILFTDNGSDIWNDKDKLHKARRNKGKSIFNAGWRDLLFTFLASLDPLNEFIKIPINVEESITLFKSPIILRSSVGYIEPKKKGRLIPIDIYYDDEELSEDGEPDEL